MTEDVSRLDSLDKLHLVLRALASRKAQDLLVLDLRGLTIIADYFVLSTGPSGQNVRAQIDAVLDEARKAGIKNVRPEGQQEATWVLLDLSDVVVHVFDPEHRDFYKLDRLWADAPHWPIPEEYRA